MGACFSGHKQADNLYAARAARTSDPVERNEPSKRPVVSSMSTNLTIRISSPQVLRLLEALAGVFDVEYTSLTATSINGEHSMNHVYRRNHQTLPGVKSISVQLGNDIVIVNDTLTDARYWQHPLVRRHPNIRSFCSIPLKLANGNWLGHISLADTKTAVLSDAQLYCLKQLTDCTTQLVHHLFNKPERASVDKANDENAFFLCDADSVSWPLLFTNDVWELNTKVYKGSKLWDSFTSNVAVEDLSAARGSVQLTSRMGEHIPVDFEPLAPTRNKGFWTEKTCDKLLWGKASMLAPGQDVPKTPWNNMILGRLLGKGSFGVVYFASWHSKIVAVKLLSTNLTSNIPQEALLGVKLTHPYVLKTYDYRAVDKNIWIIVEYCQMGALLRHIDAGMFAKDDGGKEGHRVLSQLAQGMQYLHEHDVLHGDLSTNNVLLTATGNVKVADFGMSRAMTITTVATSSYGTVTYMPPELLSKGLLSKATDVYSYGVIMYEILTSKRAFAGMTSQQIFAAKLYPLSHDTHLVLPPETPDALRRIYKGCLCDEYHDRMTFTEIVQSLQHA